MQQMHPGKKLESKETKGMKGTAKKLEHKEIRVRINPDFLSTSSDPNVIKKMEAYMTKELKSKKVVFVKDPCADYEIIAADAFGSGSTHEMPKSCGSKKYTKLTVKDFIARMKR